MDMLLIVPKYNNKFNEDYEYIFPLGLGYISAALKEAGHNVDILNLNHYVGTIKDLINEKLNKKKYDFAATGNSAIGYAVIATIIQTVKAHPTSPKIILGGPIITTMPELAFKDLGADYGVIGEGEESVVELLDFIKKNKSLRKVKGIIFKEGDKLIITEKRDSTTNLDSLPFPDFEGLEFKKQLDHTHCNTIVYATPLDHPRMYPLLASRSCPFQCTFCYHWSRYRQRSLENIMLEINMAIDKYDINFLLIYDDCFAFDKERLKKFCVEIKKIMLTKNKEIKWMCQLMVNVVDNSLLEILKDAGCVAISYGFESYSPIVLKSMRKAITPEQIDFAFKTTIKNKLNVQANFIFGDIAETKETSQETLNWWKKNSHNQVYLSFVRPYPGSELYKHCLKKGIIKDELVFIKEKMNAPLVPNMTNQMTDKDLEGLRKQILTLSADGEKYQIPSKIKKEGKNIYQVMVQCPYCKSTNIYKNCFIPNLLNFDFQLICKNCYMRYFVANIFRKLLRQNYYLLSPLIDFYLMSVKKYKKKKIIQNNIN
jgi:anaerobic magnesium-protoporphyrin IX monomethyl ester cyclase